MDAHVIIGGLRVRHFEFEVNQGSKGYPSYIIGLIIPPKDRRLEQHLCHISWVICENVISAISLVAILKMTSQS